MTNLRQKSNITSFDCGIQRVNVEIVSISPILTVLLNWRFYQFFFNNFRLHMWVWRGILRTASRDTSRVKQLPTEFCKEYKIQEHTVVNAVRQTCWMGLLSSVSTIQHSIVSPLPVFVNTLSLSKMCICLFWGFYSAHIYSIIEDNSYTERVFIHIW